MTVSVVIPAFNEAEALKRSLPALAAQDFGGPAELIVVANGCTDDTVAVAARLARDLPANWIWRVLDLPRAEKSAALNAADSQRELDLAIYLDADIVLSPRAVSRLVAYLDGPGPRLAQPRIVIGDQGGSARAVRAFVRVWASLPYVRGQVLGVGCYAVNRAGRLLWGPFPELAADDTYVRMRFEDDQKSVISGAEMTLSFPTSLRELIGIRARWCRRSREVRRREADLPASERGRALRAAKWILARPALWLDGATFSVVWLCAVARSRAPHGRDRWPRASSSPVRAPATAPSSQGGETTPRRASIPHRHRRRSRYGLRRRVAAAAGRPPAGAGGGGRGERGA